MAAKKAQNRQKTLSRRYNELRRRAEKQLRKGWQRTLEALPPAPRKTVKRWVADAERAGRQLRKRADRMFADGRKRVDRVTGDVEKRVESVVKPLTRRLDVASRTDVERLRKRLTHLEHRVTARREQPHATA